jgi:hypothetical protein
LQGDSRGEKDRLYPRLHRQGGNLVRRNPKENSPLSDKKEDFWEVAATYRRFAQHKLCLAENASDPCNSPVIKAHTIPRSQLKQIAQHSYVYSGPSMMDLVNAQTMPSLKKTGIGQFSTLNCFCARHDNLIFSDLEDTSLVFSPRQLALLHYRTVAAELYKKLGSNKASSRNIETFSKKPKYAKLPQRLHTLKGFNDGQSIAIRDGRAALEDCANVLSQHAYDRLSGLVVRFKRAPSIMCVGGFYPEFDFNGHLLQTLGNAKIQYETASFNVLASKGCAALAIIWWKGHNRCLKFAKSYKEQRPDHYTTLAIQAAFEHFENTCVAPQWWESLRQVEQNLLTHRLIFAGGMSQERENNCLQYTGVTHDDWKFEDLEFVNC